MLWGNQKKRPSKLMTHPLKGYLYKSYVRIWPSVNFYPPPPQFSTIPLFLEIHLLLSYFPTSFSKIFFRNSYPLGPFNNYVTLKLAFFYPPTTHHHASWQIITRPSLRYVMSDTGTLLSPPPLSFISLFWSWNKNKDTHPPMLLSNWTKLSDLNKR